MSKGVAYNAVHFQVCWSHFCIFRLSATVDTKCNRKLGLLAQEKPLDKKLSL